MKKVLILAIVAAIVMFVPSFASAQTANGTLAVTATVQGSIGLVFNTDVAGVTLGGSGTPNATLAFGAVSAFGAIAVPNVTRTVAANSFTVSSPVDVNVTKTNSASANYKLTAQLASADAVNTWQVGGITVTNGAAVQIAATAAYATNNNFPVAITIPFTTASGTLISNTINYQATAN